VFCQRKAWDLSSPQHYEATALYDAGTVRSFASMADPPCAYRFASAVVPINAAHLQNGASFIWNFGLFAQGKPLLYTFLELEGCRMIRVAVVDDETLIRESLAALISLSPEFEVVAQGANGDDALQIAAWQRPDVMLLDVRMPGANGVATAREIHAHYQSIKVIMLSTFPHEAYVIEGLRAGAKGYLLKSIDSDKLLEAIRAAHAGKSVLDPSLTDKVIEHIKKEVPTIPQFHERLTQREREVLALLAEGASNAEIANRLHISKGTAKNHVSHILAKLCARDRAHAARLAIEWGLLNAD
jgi:DNA-binding NarL/FixJ family response regulator